MVGTHFSKCLQCKSLLKVFVLVPAFALLTGQVSLGRAAKTGKLAAKPMAMLESLVEFTPDAVTFQDVPIGEAYTQSVRLTNVGENTLEIRKISTSNADFQITGILLPVVVAHGTSESFTISFRRLAEGRADGQISILTNSSDTPMVITVRGSTVKAQSELTASEAVIEFEDVAVGSAAKQEVSLTNAGTRDLTISGMSVTGADFDASGGTAMRLTPGQSVTVGVNFAPKSAGKQSGQLTISSSEGSRVTLPLTAVGVESSRSSVRLSWEESPVTVAGYIIYRAGESSGPYTRISQAATSEYVDTGLAAGHTYYYVVTSLDANDVESESSSPISATVPEG
jgi:hypothetical protein